MPRKRSYPLPRFSVERPVTVVMMLVALLVVGYIAYSRIPINLFPKGFNNPRLSLWTAYPNASPIEVEQKVTRLLEEAISTVGGIDRIYTNSNRGGCWTSINFRQDTDMDLAYAQLRDRIDRVMPELPDEVEHIRINRWSETDIPLMFAGITFEGEIGDPRYILEQIVSPTLQRVNGVGQVEVWGIMPQEVIIELSQAKVRSHGFNPYAFASKAQNFTLPGGYVHEGGKKVFVRSVGKFQTVDELEGLMVDPERNLRLRDVATVGYDATEESWINRVNGEEMIGVRILSASGANTVATSRALKAAFEELGRMPLLQGIKFQVFWDQGKHVVESNDNLKKSGLWGGLLAAIVLFFFLRAVRMTMIITLAIPLSILATITGLFFYGWSLNMGTMLGLMLSLGLVVDNAIVIVENIYRKRQNGVEARKAAIEGAGEVGLAVTMATLTTVVVFLPLILMSDNQGFSFWMLRIGMPVIVGLVASLFIALVFIPLAAQRLSPRAGMGELKFIVGLSRLYERLLRWILNHRVDAFIIVLVSLASIQIPMNAMQRSGDESGNQRELQLRFEMPSGQTLEQADAFMSSVEDTLLAHKERYNVKSLRAYFRQNWGGMELVFDEPEGLEWYEVAYDNLLKALELREDPYLDYDAVVKDIKERVVLKPGVRMRVGREATGDNQDAAVSINLYGDDTMTLLAMSEEVERRLEAIPGLLSVTTDVERGSTELQIRLDRAKVERYGIDPAQISGSIAYTFRGAMLGRFNDDDGREVAIWMRLQEEDRRTIQQLRNLVLTNSEGREVPLESVASLYVTRTLGGITRENRQTMLSVRATASKENAPQLFGQIDQAMGGLEMPRGYRWDKGARYERLQEDDAAQQFALMMSVMFVFLLMGVLFESFVLPLSVIVSIPFSFLGVYWTLYLTDTDFSVLALIGTVILVGVVVNNAIVLVDLANRYRDEGMERFDALVEAGRHRFRPILMTTFTTAFGLIPMAVGNSNMVGMPYAPLGRTMMGGLMASTVLTLVLVPLFYTFFDDLRVLLQRVLAAAAGKTDKGQEPAPGG